MLREQSSNKPTFAPTHPGGGQGGRCGYRFGWISSNFFGDGRGDKFRWARNSLILRSFVSSLEAVRPLRIFGDHLLRVLSYIVLETALFSRGSTASFKGYWDVGKGSEGSRQEQKRNLQRVAQELVG